MEDWHETQLISKIEKKRKQFREEGLRNQLCVLRIEMMQKHTYQQLALLLETTSVPQSSQEKWFLKLLQLLKLSGLESQKLRYLLAEKAISLYCLIRSHKSLTSFQILSLLIKNIGEKELGEMLDHGLLDLLRQTIQQSNYGGVALLALAQLTKRSSKQRNLRDFIIFNGFILLVNKALKKQPSLAVGSCAFFQALTRTQLQRSLSQDLIKVHIRFLKNKQIPKDNLLYGLCNCIKWEQIWVNQILSQTFVQGLIWIACNCELFEGQIDSIVYSLVLLSTYPTQRIEWLRPYIKSILLILKTLISAPTIKPDVLFVLSNLFGQIGLVQQIKAAVSCFDINENLIKTLVLIVKKASKDSIQALTAIHNFVNLIDSQNISDLLIKSGLLQMICSKIEAADLYSQGEIEITLEILDSVLESPSLNQAIRDSGMQQLIKQTLNKSLG